MQLRKLLLSTLVLTALLTVACGSGESPSPAASPTVIAPTATPTATATVTPTAMATVVPTSAQSVLAQIISADAASRDNAKLARALLGHVPDIELARSGFWIADYALAAHLLGIPRPDPADAAAVSQYVTALGLADTHVPPGLYLAGFSTRPGLHPARHAARQSVGFAQGDITYGITVGEADSALEVVFGDIDPEVVRALVLACGTCPQPEQLSHAGTDYFAWGRDSERSLANRFAAPLFDDAGAGGRLAVADSVAWRTMRTANMEALLAAAAGDAPSLADSDDYVELLRVLLGRQAFSIFIGSDTVSRSEDPVAFADAMFPGLTAYAQGFGFTEQQTQALREQVSAGTFPPPFETYAIASARDGDGLHTVVAYIYATEELAVAAQPAIEQRASEAQTLRTEEPYSTYSPAVTVEGRVVLVRLDGNLAEDFVTSSEPVFAHQ